MIKNNTIDLSIYKYEDRENTKILRSLETLKKFKILTNSEIVDDKVYVTYSNGQLELKVIYRYIPIEHIYENINDDIDISFCYIKEFYINQAPYNELNNLKAFASIWVKTIFDNAEFKDGTVDFSYSRFYGLASFGESKYINCPVNFENSLVYATDLFFSESQFINSEVKFNKSIFEKSEVDFSLSKFDKSVDFASCYFGGKKTSFLKCTFEGELLNFDSANFLGELTEFEGIVCYSNISLKDVKINIPTFSFNSSNFHNCRVNIHSPVFNSKYFSINKCCFKESRLSIMECYLDKTTTIFDDCELDELEFVGVVFEKDVSISCISVNKLEINNCKIKADFIMDKYTFFLGSKDIEYNSLSFSNTTTTGNIYLDWNKNKVFEAIEQNVNYKSKTFEERKKIKNVENNFRGNLSLEEFDREIKKYCDYDPINDRMTQYRMLKNNFNRIGYHEDEDKALVKFMDNYLELNNTKSSKFTKWLFSNIGGYGTDPKSIITFALFLVFMFACFYTILGVETSEPAKLIPYEMLDGIFKCILISINKFIVSFYFSGITFLTVGYGDVLPTSGLIMFLTVVEGFLGVFTMSYFSVAVVRKILR